MSDKPSLRERARQAFEADLEEEAEAQRERDEREATAVARKLQDLLGVEACEMTFEAPRVIVDGIPFMIREDGYRFLLHLIRVCPECGEEVMVGPISGLSDVGKYLETKHLDWYHDCMPRPSQDEEQG